LYRRILLPVDDSEATREGLRELASFVSQEAHEVCLIHVVQMRSEESYPEGTVGDMMLGPLREAGNRVLDSAHAKLAEQGILADRILAEAHRETAAELIGKYARQWQADLIVMGTHARHGVVRLVLGSQTAEVVRASPVPVLVVHRQNENPSRTPQQR
jgi:nucleotide-binding universal stress UspA family protein